MTDTQANGDRIQEELDVWWESYKKTARQSFSMRMVDSNTLSPEETERIKNEIRRRVSEAFGIEYIEYTSKW